MTINLTVTSKGRQFDRLALMFLGDVEVFRTSTAEPTFTGIVWTYVKDMSQYTSLWRKPQKLIFDLGNLIDDTYTASFNVTLRVSFWVSSESLKTADIILPISAQRSSHDSPSAFNIPLENATTTHVVPVGAVRGVVSISACGQAAEEFWYSNVLSSDVDAFTSTTGQLNGFSPFREVQLLIDGSVAGVVWPFPVIFTGGIAPGFWRPVVGIDAFDLREPEIDITPFLPLLADGRAHVFEIRVVGLDDAEDGSAQLSTRVGLYWVVTGKIFIFLDSGPVSNLTEDSQVPQIYAQHVNITVAHSWQQDLETGANESLSYTVRVSRSLTVISSLGSWTQALSYSNDGHITQQGVAQSNEQVTISTSYSLDLRDSETFGYQTNSSYPISVNSSYVVTDEGFTIEAALSRGLHFSSSGNPAMSTFTLTAGPSRFDTTQYGSASYSSINGKGSFSAGDTTQDFWETSEGTSYHRYVRAVNGSVVSSEPGIAINSGPLKDWDVSPGRSSVRSLLGRGPHNSR